MGLFDKVKSILFEEEEVEEEVQTIPEKKEVVKPIIREEAPEYKPIFKEEKEEVKVKENLFNKVDNDDFVNERDLFKSESTFKFPAFDEEEFETSMPKERVVKPSNNNQEYDKRRRPERRFEHSRFESDYKEDIVREEKKRFKPTPVISPVYGILDKDYKVEDIKEAPKRDNNIISSKDYVESVRAKAFGKLKNDIEESSKAKEAEEPIKLRTDKVTVKEKITLEPVKEDSHKLIEERSKTIDELLNDVSDEVINIKESQKELADEIEAELEKTLDIDIDSFEDTDQEDEVIINNDEDVIEEDNDEVIINNDRSEDTLENDLYDLIDSMYDNTEDGE